MATMVYVLDGPFGIRRFDGFPVLFPIDPISHLRHPMTGTILIHSDPF